MAGMTGMAGMAGMAGMYLGNGENGTSPPFGHVSHVRTPPKSRRRLPYNKVGANVGENRTNNRDKNQNWMVFRMKVSGANTNNRNFVA